MKAEAEANKRFEVRCCTQRRHGAPIVRTLASFDTEDAAKADAAQRWRRSEARGFAPNIADRAYRVVDTQRNTAPQQ